MSSQALTDFVVNNITALIVTIVGVVITELALYHYFKNREKPKITMSAVKKGNKLGISVSVDKKMIKDARVRCNNTNYSWEDGENKTERKDLYVGDSPSSFFPFETKIEYVENIRQYARVMFDGTEDKGLVISILDRASKQPISTFGYAIPKGSTTVVFMGQYWNQPLVNLSIRLIGEGIEEVTDYSLYVTLGNLVIPTLKEDKPNMDDVKFSFQIKKK